MQLSHMVPSQVTGGVVRTLSYVMIGRKPLTKPTSGYLDASAREKGCCRNRGPRPWKLIDTIAKRYPGSSALIRDAAHLIKRYVLLHENTDPVREIRIRTDESCVSIND